MSASLANNNSAPIASSDYSGIEEHSGPLHSFLEYATSVIFPVLFVLNLYWASSRLYELDLLWLIALTVPLGVIGGDLVSGIVHWAADTYCSVDTPVVEPSLVKPFRMHHVYPRDICTHNLHHTEPFNRHYCITNGWLNPLLNKIKFFRRLEATLAFFGIRTANSKGG